MPMPPTSREMEATAASSSAMMRLLVLAVSAYWLRLRTSKSLVAPGLIAWRCESVAVAWAMAAGRVAASGGKYQKPCGPNLARHAHAGAHRPMTASLPEPPAPQNPATRADIEGALAAHPGPVRFTAWHLPDVSLKNLDLHGCEFYGLRAPRADFSGGGLTEARFSGCDLNTTTWHGAKLAAAHFADCKLTGAHLTGAHTLGLIFERCLLISAHVHRLSFRREKLTGLDFHGADLTEADFRDAVLIGCNLRDAQVIGARFEGADLRGADLGALRLTDVSRFKGATISKAQAAGLVLALGLKLG